MVNTDLCVCVLFNNAVKFLRTYNISDSWTDEYGALVEWYYKEKEKNTSKCHTIHHKSHIDRPGTEPRPPQWENKQLTTSTMTQSKQIWYAYILHIYKWYGSIGDNVGGVQVIEGGKLRKWMG
jgi:hypothetical protein